MSKCALCASVLLYNVTRGYIGLIALYVLCSIINTLCAVLHRLVPCTARHRLCRASLHCVRCTRPTSNTPP